MATIYSGASGPWSSTATWTGGVVPTASDSVVIAGHSVTLDQDVTVVNVSSNGAGLIELVGSTSFSFTATGTITAQNLTRSGFLVRSDYTANSTFDIYQTSFNALTTTTYVGLFDFELGSGGSVSVTIERVQGKTSTSGGSPYIFNYLNNSTTSSELTLGSYASFGRMGMLQAGYGDPSFTLNTNGTTIAGSVTPISLTIYYTNGTIVINGGLVSNIPANFAITRSTSTTADINIILNGDVSFGANSALFSLSARTTLTMNGNASPTSPTLGQTLASSQGSLVLNGDLTTNYSNASILAVNLSGTDSLVLINGNITSLGAGPAVRNRYGRTIIGLKDQGRTYKIASLGPAAAVSTAIQEYARGNKYIFEVPDDSAWPSPLGDSVLLTEAGAGPSPDKIRRGTINSIGKVGTLDVPPINAVRAGVAVDASVGVALVDNADLANITGGQIASLSE